MHIAVTKPLFAWDCLDDSPDLRTVGDFPHALPDGRLLEIVAVVAGPRPHAVQGRAEAGPQDRAGPASPPTCRPSRRGRTASPTPVLATKDASGHVVDLHALRRTFITRLARSGVTPAVAKSLVRHSTIVLTMDHDTHALIREDRAALAKLPSIGSKNETTASPEMVPSAEEDSRRPARPRDLNARTSAIT